MQRTFVSTTVVSGLLIGQAWANTEGGSKHSPAELQVAQKQVKAPQASKPAALVAVSEGYNFKTADEWFAKRENSKENIAKARELYLAALKSPQLSKAERLRAVEQLARLAYYEGELLTLEKDSKGRKAIFEQCREVLKEVSPNKIGEKTGLYYYWQAVCIANWAKAVGMLKAMGSLGELKEALKEGSQFPAYEKGGIFRVSAGVRAKASALSGLKDREKALEEINRALKEGPQYWNVYLLKAEILEIMGKKDEALTFLKEKVPALNTEAKEGKWPAGLEPESKVILERLNKKCLNK